MSLPRVSLMARLALTMGAISVAAVALSMTLVYHALDGSVRRSTARIRATSSRGLNGFTT